MVTPVSPLPTVVANSGPNSASLRWAWRAPLSPDRLAARLWWRLTSVAAQGVDPIPHADVVCPQSPCVRGRQQQWHAAHWRAASTHTYLGCCPPTLPLGLGCMHALLHTFAVPAWLGHSCTPVLCLCTCRVRFVLVTSLRSFIEAHIDPQDPGVSLWGRRM